MLTVNFRPNQQLLCLTSAHLNSKEGCQVAFEVCFVCKVVCLFTSEGSMERLKANFRLPFSHDVDHKSHQIKLMSRNFFDAFPSKNFSPALTLGYKNNLLRLFLLDYVLMPKLEDFCLKFLLCKYFKS